MTDEYRHAGYDPVGINGPWFQDLPTGKCEKPLRQHRAALRAAHGCLDLALRLERTGLLKSVLCHFEITDDHGQQVVEVVCDTAGELADGFHLLRLMQLVFDAPLVGNVGVQRDETAFGERIAPKLHGLAIRPCSRDRSGAYAGVDHLQAAAYFLFDVDWPEFSGDRLSTQDIGQMHPFPQHLGRHANEPGEILVPFHKPQFGIQHHQAIRHAGEDCLPLGGLVIRQRSHPGEVRPDLRQCILMPSGGTIGAKQEAEQPSDSGNEYGYQQVVHDHSFLWGR
nr:hypothetical protein [Acidisphaera sp. S103]